MDMTNILTVSQLSEANPAFTEPMIRWWIFNAEKNGFNACLVRVGGRVFVDRAAFERWLDQHRVEVLSDPEFESA